EGDADHDRLRHREERAQVASFGGGVGGGDIAVCCRILGDQSGHLLGRGRVGEIDHQAGRERVPAAVVCDGGQGAVVTRQSERLDFAPVCDAPHARQGGDLALEGVYLLRFGGVSTEDLKLGGCAHLF